MQDLCKASRHFMSYRVSGGEIAWGYELAFLQAVVKDCFLVHILLIVAAGDSSLGSISGLDFLQFCLPLLKAKLFLHDCLLSPLKHQCLGGLLRKLIETCKFSTPYKVQRVP